MKLKLKCVFCNNKLTRMDYFRIRNSHVFGLCRDCANGQDPSVLVRIGNIVDDECKIVVDLIQGEQL